MDAEIDEYADEDEERYCDPEFGLVDKLHGHSFRATATGDGRRGATLSAALDHP